MARIHRSKYIILVITLILMMGASIMISKGFPVQKIMDLPTQKPNIIIILADDAGYADFGFMGSKDMRTPHLDQLASDGVVFTDAHVTASVCSPSRAGLLTGRYQQRFGHECNLEPDQPGAFDSAQVTIAEYLKSKNYHTSIIGKWHLGEEHHQHPLNNGFDYFWGFLAGGRSYFPDPKQDESGASHAIMENHKYVRFNGYLTDVLGERASDYIMTVGKDHPFFMYLAFNAPHTPKHAKQEVVRSFGDDHDRPVYAAMVWSMDEAIGKVIETLKKENLYENTLIFFLSDNGGAHNNGSSVDPLKGWKGNQFEGGTRVPFTVTWKGHLPSGERFSGLSSSLDIYGTIASFWDDNNELDGTDLIPYLTGQIKGDPHQSLYWRKDEMATIRSGAYKLISLQDSMSVVYDLSHDLTEEHDLRAANPDLSNDLQADLDNWQKELMTPLWREPENWNTVTRRIYRDLMQNRPALVREPADLKEQTRISRE